MTIFLEDLRLGGKYQQLDFYIIFSLLAQMFISRLAFRSVISVKKLFRNIHHVELPLHTLISVCPVIHCACLVNDCNVLQ